MVISLTRFLVIRVKSNICAKPTIHNLYQKIQILFFIWIKHAFQFNNIKHELTLQFLHHWIMLWLCSVHRPLYSGPSYCHSCVFIKCGTIFASHAAYSLLHKMSLCLSLATGGWWRTESISLWAKILLDEFLASNLRTEHLLHTFEPYGTGSLWFSVGLLAVFLPLGF